MSESKKAALVHFLLLVCLSFGYAMVIWPGMYGPFVLDDWWNLGRLEYVKNWHDVWVYTITGNSGTLGRPIAYLSFALQADNWAHNPFAFKALNAMIHWFNGVLLYCCAYLCSSLIGITGKKRILFAGMCSFLWVLMPLNTTTVFYVVQRMTLLAGMFTLIGILGFLWGVIITKRSGSQWGVLIASGSMFFGYLFGVFSKENSIMLGVFVGAIYFSIVRGQLQEKQKTWDYWIFVVAFLPVALVFIYLLFWGGGGYSSREFTLSDRLLTEWRILWDYLLKIVFPSPSRINLYNDDFSISRGLFDPFSTIIAGAAWSLVIVAAVNVRSTLPCFLFGVIWFLGGHLLESTFIPLELYYEHRNYLPSVGVILALVWFLFHVFEKIQSTNSKKERTIAMVFFPLMLAVMIGWNMTVFYLEAKTWKDDYSFHVASLSDRPNSLRVNQLAAIYMGRRGHVKESANMFYHIEKRWPGNPSTYAHILLRQCMDKSVVVPSDDELDKRFLTGDYDSGAVISVLDRMYDIKTKGGCNAFGWNKFRHWLSLLMENKNYPKYGRQQMILQTFVQTYVSERRFTEAVDVLNAINVSALSIETMRQKLGLLVYLGRNNEALELIQVAKNRFEKNIKLKIKNEPSFIDMENKIIRKQSKIKRVFEAG